KLAAHRIRSGPAVRRPLATHLASCVLEVAACDLPARSARVGRRLVDRTVALALVAGRVAARPGRAHFRSRTGGADLCLPHHRNVRAAERARTGATPRVHWR